MRRKKIHNALSAIFLVMVITAPLAIKNLHHHANLLNVNYASCKDKSFAGTVKTCLICQFVPENSTAGISVRYIFIREVEEACMIPEFQSSFIARFYYFSLRAPPSIS